MSACGALIRLVAGRTVIEDAIVALAIAAGH